MRKIDRLMMKVRDAKRADSDALILAFIAPASLLDEPEESPNYNRWELIAYFGTSGGKIAGSDIAFYETQEEAEQAAHEMESAHGAGSRDREAVYVSFTDRD